MSPSVNNCIQLICFFCVSIMMAQPDFNYIEKMRGTVDVPWLISIGDNIQASALNWELQTAPGFNKGSQNAPKEAVLGNLWHFYPIEKGKTLSEPEKVRLPHNFDNRHRNYVSGWYLSNYNISKKSDKRYVLKLNRIQIFSEVYVNGVLIGHHFGGYTPFDFEITEALRSGNNTIAVFVRDQSAALDNGKIYNQVGVTRLGNYKPDGGQKLIGGIDSKIILEEKEQAHVEHVFVKTSTRQKTLEISYEIAANNLINTTVLFELLQWPNGEKVALNIPEIRLNKRDNTKQTYKVKWENPNLWSPEHPNLYILRTTLKNGKNTEVVDTRFGFREFWIEGKQFMLNGVPTRLRGESHYRSSKEDIDYHRETFLMHKKVFEINTCRIHATMPPNEIIYGADEAGILIINQSAIWSVNKPFYSSGGNWFAKNLEKEFEEWVKRDRNNPSVIIWDVENEMLRFNADTYEWIQYLPSYIKKFDTTRPINYSGAGWFADHQEMVSLHMQEHYTRIMKDWQVKGTRPLIMGEFWVGGRSEQRLSNAYEFSSVLQRDSEEAKLYQEKILEMRNMGVAGAMPFRTGLLSFNDKPFENGSMYAYSDGSKTYLQPESVLQKMRHALQPVTTFFWPRETYVANDESLKKELVVCNDSEMDKIVTISWKWLEKKLTKQVLIKPGSQERIVLNLEPTSQNTSLTALVEVNSRQISADTLTIKPLVKSSINQTKRIQIYNDHTLAATLKKAGFNAFSSENIPSVKDHVIWIFPEHANNRKLTTIKNEIESYLNNGGAILSLKQDQAPTWFPVKFQFSSANQSNLHNYAKMGWEGLNKDLFFSTEAPIFDKSHSIFKGLNAEILHGWNVFDGRIADDVFARPSSNNKYEQGNWKPLTGGTRREQISLAELFYGKGLLLACQLHVIENLKNAQAHSLFVNMINYLSHREPVALQNKIAVAGNQKAKNIAEFLEIAETVFEGANPARDDYMLAFDETPLETIQNWTSMGGKVLVLSPMISQKFEGVKYQTEKGSRYLATKQKEHPLFSGVASANFMNDKQSMVKGYFSQIPENSQVLLQGFESQSTYWKVEDAGPVAIAIPFGKGEIILSTIEINEQSSASAKEFLSLILTNSGVAVSFKADSKAETLIIKKTVPVTIDGKLEEWLVDMEDKFVTQYIHANPVYLTGQNIIEGDHGFDSNLSAINYMMWNQEALHIAGIVFMEKLFFGTERYPGPKNYTQEIKYHDDVILISQENGNISISVNSKALDISLMAKSQMNSDEMTDATQLQFDYIHASGKIHQRDALIGDTFEIKIPWNLLKSTSKETHGKILFTLQNNTNKIQKPLNADTTSKQNWLEFKIEE